MRWSDVNFFDNAFSQELGEALVPRDPSSRMALRALKDVAIAASSPDAALGGNLPKRWELRGSDRVLVKSGKRTNMFVEPVCELLATKLCELVLEPGDYVPYRVETYQWPIEFVSVCPCMVDGDTELESAFDVARSNPARSDLSRYENYCRACESHGVSDIRTALAKMLVVDHVIANFDRHWGNFGVVVDSETRQWLRAAPLYDNGESFYCNQLQLDLVQRPLRSRGLMPFAARIDEQLSRYAEDFSWLDANRLREFPDIVGQTLLTSAMVRNAPGRIDAIVEATRSRIADVAEAQSRRSHKAS